MASSGIQIIGFLFSLAGCAATLGSIFMVEWRKESQGKHRIYEGLWMTCSGTERTTCELHQSVLKLSNEVQATRAVMLVSLFLSAVALVTSVMGMKCTTFMSSMPESKRKVVLSGGVFFMLSGLLTITITSWFVSRIVEISHGSHHLHVREFGNAVFVSGGGGIFTTMGGAFLSCQRCWKSRLTQTIDSNQLSAISNK